jgi:hypothetical protein
LGELFHFLEQGGGTALWAEVFAKKVPGMADGPDLEPTEHPRGGGQATRTVRIADHGPRHEIEVTVFGWNVWRLIDAATTVPRPSRWGRFSSMGPTGPKRGSPKPAPLWLARPVWTKWSLRGAFGRTPLGGGWTGTGFSSRSRPKRPGSSRPVPAHKRRSAKACPQAGGSTSCAMARARRRLPNAWHRRSLASPR